MEYLLLVGKFGKLCVTNQINTIQTFPSKLLYYRLLAESIHLQNFCQTC